MKYSQSAKRISGLFIGFLAGGVAWRSLAQLIAYSVWTTLAVPGTPSVPSRLISDGWLSLGRLPMHPFEGVAVCQSGLNVPVAMSHSKFESSICVLTQIDPRKISFEFPGMSLETHFVVQLSVWPLFCAAVVFGIATTLILEALLTLHTRNLNEARQKARNSVRAEIAAKLAHDIRSPLGALKSLRAERSESQANGALIQNVILRITEIADQSLASLMSGDVDKHDDFRISNPTSLIQGIIDEKVAAAIPHSRTHIEFSPPTSPCQSVVGEPTGLCRVLSNLLQNALEATPPGKKIVIQTGTNSNGLWIRLIDQGCGISPGVVAKLEAGDRVTTKLAGNGLGFSASKKLIEGWGGRLSLTSEISLGTVVELILPFK